MNTIPDELDDIAEELALNFDHRNCKDDACMAKQVYWKYYTKLDAYVTARQTEAELYGRLHETIEAFRAGAIDADTYSKRHAELTDRITKIKQGEK